MKKSLLHKITSRLHYNPLWMNVLKLTGKKVQHKKWIFIIGCYNSGTTLLNQIIGSHSQISVLPDEGVMLTDRLTRPEDFACRRMWVNCEKEMLNGFEGSKKDADAIKRHWSHFYDMEAEFLVEKSISNTVRLNFFEKNFQPVFVHIVRNGYAVAEGIRRKSEIMPGNPHYENNRYPLSACAEQWVASLKKVEQAKQSLNNFIEITYEGLCENPEAELHKIFEELDLDLPKVNSSNLKRKFKIHEKDNYIENMNSKSFERLDAKAYEEINSVAEEYLSKYGYKIRD